MNNAQLRRIYTRNRKRINMYCAISMVAASPASIIYAITGWVGAIAVAVFEDVALLGLMPGYIKFIPFIAASLAMLVQGENYIAVPLVFFVYMIFDVLFSDAFSVFLIIMLMYLIYAAYKAARHEADLNVMRELPSFPFTGSTDDDHMATYRNNDIIKELEKTAKNVEYNKPSEPKEEKPPEREEYTARRW